MDINELMSRSRPDEEEEDDSPILMWGELRKVLGLNPSLPEYLVEDIFWKHLASQPLRRLFELRLVCKRFQQFLTDSDSLKRHPIHESCVLKENCVQKLGCKHRGNGNVCWGTEDVLQRRFMPMPIPSSPTAPSCRDPTCMESTWSSLDGWRVSSGQGGEPGLLYLQKRRASAPASPSRIESPSIAEWLALNPVTKSTRQLPRGCLGDVPKMHFLWSVDKFSSGYLSWASDGDEQMYPLLLDPLSNAWKRIGSGFRTRSRIRVAKAVQNGVVYLRYEEQNLKDRLIVYEILQGSFHERITTGLPNNICEELIFQYAGHIYLAAVEVGSFWAEENVVVYELKSTESSWMMVSKMPSELMLELTDFNPALSELKFFHIDHDLVLASSVTRRRTDGTDQCHCATVTYGVTTRSWRKDEPGRLPSDFDFRTTRTTVFRPSLDIEA